MVEELAHFGPFLTVIDDKPYRLNVNYQKLAPDSGDRTARHPYYYNITAWPILMQGDFIINPTRVLLERFLGNDLKKLHLFSIKFGIIQLRNGIRKGKISLTSKEYKSSVEQDQLSSFDLRIRILEFVAFIGREWPQESIKADDIELNFNADKNEIGQWLKTLYEEKLLIQGREDNAPMQFSKGTRGIFTYRINPENRNRVETELAEFRGQNDDSDNGNHRKLKAFFSYSSRNKKIAGQIKAEFEVMGIEVFLAHEDIKVTKLWEEKILSELADCDIFIGLITRQFMTSDWTYQEAGNAIGGGKSILSIMHGGELKGFLKRFQYVQFSRARGKVYIRKIISSLLDNASLRNRFIRGLIQRLRDSDSYQEAIGTAEILSIIREFDSEHIDNMISSIVENNQVYDSGGAMRMLTPILIKNRNKITEVNYDRLLEKDIDI